ncbi:DUF6973 domain-containing protein [Aquimarina litoralis]|uniref:DUF6973 domain-containing protein n=1 Tax=Aquimarina litoralis TaxID=584605 RepID=UPI001C559845|nr:hypothetical protein [Aquimarina litoralis]MBW1293997.1 hypothetical protein [Aquimarina litoralis]
MNIRSLIKRFNFRQLFKIAGLGIQRPLYIVPTLSATKKTMVVCDTLYGKEHHLSGRANAFRHALWNILICQKVFKISGDETKSALWTKKVTDLHEKLAPNEALEEAMDLHNNKLGRIYFKKLTNASEEELITFLREQLNKAKLITSKEQTKIFGDNMVYISETKSS